MNSLVLCMKAGTTSLLLLEGNRLFPFPPGFAVWGATGIAGYMGGDKLDWQSLMGVAMLAVFGVYFYFVDKENRDG